MSTLDRLLGYLTGAYDSTAAPLLALRLSYETGQMQWSIAGDTLTTTPSIGGTGEALSVDLSLYTIATLSNFLGAQTGYEVLYLDQSGSSSLSALALVPGTGDIATSNGDHIYVAQNPIWTHLAAIAAELELAADAIRLGPLEMQTTTADDGWLDLLGSYYAVPRQLGEQDAQYSPRIPTEVILPRQNNTAIAAALEASTGQIATVDDAPVFGNPQPAFDGQIGFSGAPHFYNASAALILNLFDVAIGYDLLGGLSPTDFLVLIRRQIDRLRAAGTHLRNLTLTASVMGDTYAPGPTDALTEILDIQGITGSGESFDSGVVAGIFPTLLVPLSFSSNAAIGALTTRVQLVGTGVSIDSVAFTLPPATGASADAGIANLSSGVHAALAGSGGSIDSTFGSLGSAAILNGVSSSINTSGSPAIGPSFSSGFSSGFARGIAGYGVTLQIGPQLGYGASSDVGIAALTTSIRSVGTGLSANTTTAALLSAIRLSGTGADSESGVAALTTAIRLVGSGTSSYSAALASGSGGFSSDFSSDFAH